MENNKLAQNIINELEKQRLIEQKKYNSRIGVAAFIQDSSENLLLLLRKKDPEIGFWTLPEVR